MIPLENLPTDLDAMIVILYHNAALSLGLFRSPLSFISWLYIKYLVFAGLKQIM